MTITLLSEDFTDTANFSTPWVSTNGSWRRFAYQHQGATGTALYNAAFYVNATGAYAAPPMGKLVLGQSWYSLLAGDSTHDKVAELTAYVRWRAQVDTYNLAGVTTNGQTTYLGLQFAGVSSGISGYVALISRAGGTGVTTLSIVKTSGAYTAPTMTSIGGAAVTLPTAVEGDRWQVKVRGTWLAPSFTLASFLVTVTTATGAAYTVGMPSALPISQYATDTGQSGTTWATVDAYVGFLNRPSVPLFAPFTSQGDAVPNQWETLRLKDVGALSTPETATVAPSLVGQPTLTVVPVDAEDDPSGLELSINPSFTVALSDQWIVNELVADSGDHTQFPRQTKRRRRWQFHWSALDSTEFDTLSTLNDDIGGRYQSVTWEDPTTGLSETIRFITPISFSQVGPDTWKASATVEEVFT